jgi:flagellar hook protein FlgE
VGSSKTIDPNQLTGDIQIPLDKTLARATSNIVFSGNLNSATTVGTASADGGSYTTTVGVYDSLGYKRSAVLTFTRQAVDTDGNSVWSWKASAPEGSTYNVSGGGSVSFDSSGQAIKTTAVETGSESISIDGSAGADPLSVSLDLQQVTMLSSANTISASSQDGLAAGSVSDVYIGENSGEIYLLYSNGLKQLAGQIALAKFSNPSGLVRYGNSMYVEGLNSGLPQVGAPNDGTRGTLIPGYTEASNVDMAQEFTNMILAERGFQASSRVITTSDEILQELVNLKR